MKTSSKMPTNPAMLPERQHFMHTTIKAAGVRVLASEGMPQERGERERPDWSIDGSVRDSGNTRVFAC